MTPAQRTEYAEAVWEEFLLRSGQPATRSISPVEWYTLAGWMNAGIPLRVVLRGLEDTGRPGRALTYYRASVAQAAENWRKALA